MKEIASKEDEAHKRSIHHLLIFSRRSPPLSLRAIVTKLVHHPPTQEMAFSFIISLAALCRNRTLESRSQRLQQPWFVNGTKGNKTYCDVSFVVDSTSSFARSLMKKSPFSFQLVASIVSSVFPSTEQIQHVKTPFITIILQICWNGHAWVEERGETAYFLPQLASSCRDLTVSILQQKCIKSGQHLSLVLNFSKRDRVSTLEDLLKVVDQLGSSRLCPPLGDDSLLGAR